MTTKTKWRVHVFGAADHAPEISVVRKANIHGQVSYGWFGPDKLPVYSDCHAQGLPLHPIVWDGLITTAFRLEEFLNREDTQNGQQ
jgi:hypothetical protein